MLIYKTLGANAQNEFAKTWGVGYALNNVRCASARAGWRAAPADARRAPQASEWQDVAVTACKAALLIVILDALRLTKNSSWFEEHGA